LATFGWSPSLVGSPQASLTSEADAPCFTVQRSEPSSRKMRHWRGHRFRPSATNATTPISAPSLTNRRFFKGTRGTIARRIATRSLTADHVGEHADHAGRLTNPRTPTPAPGRLQCQGACADLHRTTEAARAVMHGASHSITSSRSSRHAGAPQRTSRRRGLHGLRRSCRAICPIGSVWDRGGSPAERPSALRFCDPCALAIIPSRGRAGAAAASDPPGLAPAPRRIRGRGGWTVLSDGQRATVRAVAPDAPGDRDRDLCRPCIATSHAVTTNLRSVLQVWSPQAVTRAILRRNCDGCCGALPSDESEIAPDGITRAGVARNKAYMPLCAPQTK